MNKKVYVANLPFQAGESELKALFSKAGSVMSVQIVKERQTGQPRGIAFVEMSTQWEGRRAASMLNRTDFIRLRRRPRLRAVTPVCTKRFGEGQHFGRASTALAVEEYVTLRGIVSAMHPHASADFAHWQMTHRSLSPAKELVRRAGGVGGYGYWGPRLRAVTPVEKDSKQGTSACRHGLARGAPWGKICW